MNCDQLQTFQAVAENGSFTEASRALLISQSAVSQQIRSLELSLGVQLFDRTGKDVTLTREGQLLLSRAEVIATTLQDIRVLFDDLSNLERGRLDIGASVVFGTYFLPRLIGTFHAEHPAIVIDLHAGNSHDIISQLVHGEIEFGFGGLFVDEPKVDYTLIHQEPIVAVVDSRHPLASKSEIAPEDLKGTNLILREKGTRIRADTDAWLARFDKAFLPQRTIELTNVEITKKLIAEGFGMTIIPRVAVQSQLDTGRFTALDLHGFDFSAYYYLYTPRHRRLSQAAHAMLALMLRIVPLSHADNLDPDAIGRPDHADPHAVIHGAPDTPRTG